MLQAFSHVPPSGGDGDDALLMEAVYSRGPMAVSIYVDDPAFKFYSSGVSCRAGEFGAGERGEYSPRTEVPGSPLASTSFAAAGCGEGREGAAAGRCRRS